MKKIFFGILILMPTFIFAAEINTLITSIKSWVLTLSGIFVSLSVLLFFYGLFLVLLKEEKREKGKTLIVWGIIVFFITFSIWGITTFLRESIGLEKNSDFTIPHVDGKVETTPDHYGR